MEQETRQTLARTIETIAGSSANADWTTRQGFQTFAQRLCDDRLVEYERDKYGTFDAVLKAYVLIWREFAAMFFRWSKSSRPYLGIFEKDAIACERGTAAMYDSIASAVEDRLGEVCSQ